MNLRHVITFVAAASCGGGTPCPGSLVSSTLDGGSASIVLGTNITVQAAAFVWQNGSPVKFPSVSFQFQFDTSEGATTTVGCDGEWADYSAATQPVLLSDVTCVVDVARPNAHGGFDVLGATLTTGTISTTSSLDADGNGSLTLEFDVPSTTLDLKTETQQETVQVEMVGFRGTAVFDTRDCPASCSGGINPAI